MAGTTCCSSSTPGRTTSPTSATAPPARAEGDFLLVPPDWDGTAPEAHTVIRFPTTVASIVGRWSVASDEDLPAVHALQDATTLTPVDAAAEAVGLAEPDPGVADELMFLEKLRVWSQQFPPADRDRPLQESLAPLGTTQAGASPYLTMSEEEVASLAAGLEEAKATLHQALVSGHSPEVNGWKLDLPRLRLQPGLLRGRSARRRHGSRSPTRSSASSSEPPPRSVASGATIPTRRRTS